MEVCGRCESKGLELTEHPSTAKEKQRAGWGEKRGRYEMERGRWLGRRRENTLGIQ